MELQDLLNKSHQYSLRLITGLGIGYLSGFSNLLNLCDSVVLNPWGTSDFMWLLISGY